MTVFRIEVLPLRPRSGLKAHVAQNDNKRDTVLVAAWFFGLTGIVGLSILLVEKRLFDLQDRGRVRTKQFCFIVRITRQILEMEVKYGLSGMWEVDGGRRFRWCAG
jgi:hypothetical protein